MKTKFSLIVILFSLFFTTASCQSDDKLEQENLENTNFATDKILIIYLSRTKNTKAVAEMIHQKTGGTLLELDVKNPYPTDYKTMVAQVQKENETNFLPALKSKIDRIETYDVIFLGFPTWGMQLPTPMKSFLNEYNLSGKIIVPFNTNAGYGIGSSFETVKKLAPTSTILQGFSTQGGKERDGILYVMQGEKEIQKRDAIHQWLKKLKFVE